MGIKRHRYYSAHEDAPRRSRRLAAKCSGPPRKQSTAKGISTEPISPESWPQSWPDLADRARRRIDAYASSVRYGDDKLRACMRAFLDYLPEGGREPVARDVLECGDDDDERLYEVFRELRTVLLQPMMVTSKGGSNRSSPFTERQEDAEAVAATIRDPMGRNRDFRDVCLRRDGNRCLVTRDMDFDHWEQIGEPDDELYGDVVAAHIVPFSYAAWKTNEASKEVSQMWEVLYRCFPGVRRVGLNVSKINDPSNGMILRDFVHTQFARFRCALAATDTPNVYTIKVYKRFPTFDRQLLPEDMTVTMQCATETEDISLPDPVLLDTHYRIAEILNTSGMGGYIEDRMREWEDIKHSRDGDGLNEDGSTDVARLLRYGLEMKAAC